MSKTFKAAKHTLRALSKTLEDIRTQNKNGDKWKAGAETMLEKIQKTVSNNTRLTAISAVNVLTHIWDLVPRR